MSDSNKPSALYNKSYYLVALIVILLAYILLNVEYGTVLGADGKRSYISSNPANLPKFLALPRDEPIDMLNMIRFKDLAEYEPDSEFANKGWTGAQAYAEYSRRSQVVLDRLGPEIVYSGTPAMTIIGPKDEYWDVVFVLRYASVPAFGEVMKDPEYQLHKFHRKAAVADSRLVRLAPAPAVMPQPK
jgi:hypothetical protein